MIRIGIAGIGFMGVTHYKAYQQVQGAEVHAICTRSAKKLAGDWRDVQGNFGGSGGVQDLSGVRRYADLDDLLADPDLDLIDICLPSPMHKDVAIAAMKAGKHVLVEKPLAENLADADAVVAAAEQTGCTLAVGQVLRFFPEFTIIKQIIDEGTYGEVMAAHFKRMIASSWFDDPAHTGTMIGELHIHDADFVRYLFGMPSALSASSFDGGNGHPAYVHVQYRYGDRNLCVTTNSGSIAMPELQFEHGYEVYFEQATMRYSSFTNQPVTLYTRDEQRIVPELSHTDAFQAELQYVVTALEEEQEPTILSGRSARDSLYLCEKTLQSAKLKQIVAV